MFSTVNKQKKAEELIEEAKRSLEEIDRRCDLELERVRKLVSETDSLKNHLARKTLKRFHDLFFSIKNVEPVEMAEILEGPYASQIHELTDKLESVEPIEVRGAKKGKIPALFASLVAALVTVATAIFIALLGTGTKLDISTLSSPQTQQNILAWIGGGAFNYPEASPILGGVALAAAALSAALVTWSIMMAKNSGKNLAIAEGFHADARNYRDQKEGYLNLLTSLESELSQFRDILETFDIFMQEYNAILRRIQFTEGKDYEEYGERSKEVVKRAAICAQAIVPILNITIVASDGSVSEQLLGAIEEGKRYSEALTSQKPLPEYSRVSKSPGEEERSLEVEVT